MLLVNHDAGFVFIKKLLGSKYVFKSVQQLNKGRHILCRTEKDGREHYFYCLFKHTFIHSFNFLASDFVKKYPELEGQGESINVEFLSYAKRFDATLLYIYPDGKVYQIPSLTVYNFVHKFGLIREQDRSNEYKEAYSNGMVQVIREKTAYFPIKLMSRWF